MTEREQRLEAELGNATRQHEACATKLWDAEQKVTQLKELLLEARNPDEPGWWGKVQAWIVNGAPTRSIGIATAQMITALHVKIDTALAEPASITGGFHDWLATYKGEEATMFDRGDLAACWYAAQRYQTASRAGTKASSESDEAIAGRGGKSAVGGPTEPLEDKASSTLAAPVPNADTQDTAMEELRSQHSCTVEPEALRLAQEFVSDPDRRAQVKFNLAAGGYLLVSDMIDEAVEVSRELIRLDEALRARQEEPPNHGVSFCTIRDGGDEWHLECRMVNGQKGAFVRVDKECEGLADFLAAKLNASKDAVLAESEQPAQITASSGAELVNIQRPTAFAAPSESARMVRTPLETAQEWADWIPYPDSTAAEWDRFNLANGFLRLREKVGSLESCLSIQEDAERHTHTDHLLRHWDRTCPACIAESEQDAAPSSSLRDAAVTAERKP